MFVCVSWGLFCLFGFLFFWFYFFFCGNEEKNVTEPPPQVECSMCIFNTCESLHLLIPWSCLGRLCPELQKAPIRGTYLEQVYIMHPAAKEEEDQTEGTMAPIKSTNNQ